MNLKKKLFIAAVTVLALSLHGCSPEQPGTYQNEPADDIPAPNASVKDDSAMDNSYHTAPGEDTSEESNAPKKDTEQTETQDAETEEPYSMGQKYAKLTTDDRDEIEEACTKYLYLDWITASDEIFSVNEYEIDGRGYGISESKPDMYYGGTILLACKFFYMDTPNEQHDLSLIEHRSTGVRYLTIDGAEYADTDWETVAQLEQEVEDSYYANMANAQQYVAPVQVCSQDAVYQQARQDAIQKLKQEYVIANGGIGLPDALQFGPGYRYNANNLTYYYDANAACHILTFSLDEYDVSNLLHGSYIVNAQYQDHGNGTISNISMSIQ